MQKKSYLCKLIYISVKFRWGKVEKGGIIRLLNRFLKLRIFFERYMKNKLIADAGSTKVEWVLLSDEGELLHTVSTPGINALTIDDKELESRLQSVKKQLGQEESLSEIHYYGAGCATANICSKLHSGISAVWQAGTTNVRSDLLGAARSLLGSERGIACILGTGSNSCLYDGEDISMNVPSLGYILGDEGSGAALGKRLVADAFKGHLPKPIRDKFMKYYEMNLENILEYTYRKPAASRFLASLVPFIKDHLWNPYVYSIVLEEFTSFFKRNVAMYPGARTLPLAFTGSVAYFFSDILEEAAKRQGFSISQVTRNPMPGIIKFHSKN